MSWIQQNKLPAAILGVSAAGAAGLGFLLFSAYTSYSTSLEQFNATNASLASLKSAVLPPTPENLAIKQGLVTEFNESAGQLALVLNTLQQDTLPKPTTDTEFQAKLKTKVADSRKFAADKRMGLPAVYNLTFDQYTSELPSSNELATELSGYMDAVDTIVTAFGNAGVRQVDSIERSLLDAEPGAKPARPAPKPTPGRPGAAAPAAPKLTTNRQVRAVLTLDQAALQLLMSNLASPSEMPYFTVVRLLRIENEGQEGPLRSAVAITAPQQEVGPDGEPIVAAPIPGAEAPKAQTASTQPAPPDAVAVLGNERLRVYLEIDLVHFVNAQTASTSTR